MFRPSTISFLSKKIFVRNEALPVCSNCGWFVEDKNNYPYDPIPNDELYGRCKRFSEVNMITGGKIYDFAHECRTNKNKCGKDGSE